MKQNKCLADKKLNVTVFFYTEAQVCMFVCCLFGVMTLSVQKM